MVFSREMLPSVYKTMGKLVYKGQERENWRQGFLSIFLIFIFFLLLLLWGRASMTILEFFKTKK